MLNRRQFFSGFLRKESPSEQREGRRTERANSLEKHALFDLVPGDVTLNTAQERELRRRIRVRVYAMGDDELFSMAAVTAIERLTEKFLLDIGKGHRPSRI